MRNTFMTWMSIFLFLVLAPVGGCAADAKSKSNLTAGYQALEARQYDTALAAADAQLSRSSAGPGSAEALYLKGRSLEQRPAPTEDAARRNLLAAQNAYLEALRRNPAPKLDAYIRASLGNVLYFQDDYSSALREWNDAYPALDDPSTQSWVLYRMGLCRQRLGQFEQADKIFAQVQNDYPNTLPALRAREHQGVRGFTVQFATFANPTTAQNAIESLRRDGVMPAATPDAQGRTVVRVGPLNSFQQASLLKQRYSATFPDALILP